MTTPFDPTPRPALRKAADADVHPTTRSVTTTSDSVMDGKRVELCVSVPKKLRKQIRQAAKAADISVDDLVTIATAAEVQRRTR